MVPARVRAAGLEHDHAHHPKHPPAAPAGPHRPPAPDDGPRVTRDEVRDLGRLRRSVDDRKVAGVAGGLARHLDVDPLVLRVAFVVLAFFGGAGLLLYGACWLLVPEDGSDEAAITLDDRSRTIALLVVGVLAAFALLGDSWGVFWFPWPLAIIALVVLLLHDPQGPPLGSPSPGIRRRACRPRPATPRRTRAPRPTAAPGPTRAARRTGAPDRTRTRPSTAPGRTGHRPTAPRPATRAGADRSCSGSPSR